MSTQGTLIFTAELDSSKLNKGLEDAQQRLKNGANDTAKSIKEAQQKMAGATSENLQIQKKVIAEMEREYSKLQATISQTPKGQGQDTLKAQAIQLKQAIQEEKQAFKELQTEVKATEEVHKSLRSQIKEVAEEMARLDPHSEKYRELQQELGRLKDIQGDIQQAGKVLANDEAKFQGVLTGLQGVAGGFGAVTGAMALFGAESEDVQRAMQRLMATMQIVQGVQAVAQALNKDSAFMLVTLRTLKEAYAKANVKSAVATTAETTAEEANTIAKGQNATATIADTATTVADTTATAVQTGAKITLIGVLRTLWATMLSNPITAILAGVGLLIGAIYKLTEAGREAERQQQALNEKIIEVASEPVGAFLKLRQEYTALGNDMHAKEAFIRSNAKAFDALGLSINSVADAERVLINQSGKFIQAQIAKAKATAITESDEYKNAIKKQVEYDAKVPTYERRLKEIRGDDTSGFRIILPFTEESELLYQYTKLRLEKIDADKTTERLLKQQAEYEKEGSKLMQELNKGSEPIASSIAGKRLNIQKQIKELEEGYNKLSTTDKEGIKKNIAERKALQAELDALDGKENHNKTAKSGERKETEGQKFAKQMAEEYKKAKEAHREYLLSKLTITQRYLEEDKALQEAYDKEKDDAKRKGIELQRKALRQQYETDSLKARDKEEAEKLKGFEEEQAEKLKALEDFKAKYRTFEEQITAIEIEAEQKRQQAREAGIADKAIPQIDREAQKQKSRLAMEELQTNPLYEKLFGNLDELATTELQKILALFEGQTAMLGVELSPQDLATIKDKVAGVKDTLRQRNPFAMLIQGVKDYQNATDKASQATAIKQIAKSAELAFSEVNKAINVAQEALTAFGVSADSTIGTALNGLQGAVSGGMKLASGKPLSMISGGIELVSGIFSMFGDSDKEAEKRIKAHQQAVKRLESAYQDLESAVGKALGEEQYQYADDQIRNLEAQQRSYAQMRREEQGKKKSDGDKIDEYSQKIQDLEKQKAEVVRKLQEDLLTTNAKSAAESLGSAFVEAFAKGENAVGAFQGKVNELVKNIMKQMVIKQLFEKPIGQILDKYSKRWVDSQGNFSGFSAMENDIDSLSRELNSVTDGISIHGKNLLEKLAGFSTDSTSTNSLSGEVKTVTEETAKLLEGQINAIRITSENAQASRVMMSEQIRGVLSTLNAIKGDTAHLHYLEKIHAHITTSSSERANLTAPSLNSTEGGSRSVGS